MKLLISTGDYSGDLVGSLLIKKLKELSSDLKVFAIGGPNLEAAGAEIIEESSDWGAIGVFDALKKIPKVLSAFSRIKKELDDLELDGVVYIDCPAFNVQFAKVIRGKKIRSVYFFPPSAWRKDAKRAAAVGKLVNLVIAPFQETAKLYATSGTPTFFSGHPLLDTALEHEDRKSLLREFELDPRNPVVGLFPGSRDQEIRYLLPLMLDAADLISFEMRSVQFLLPIARESLEPLILEQIKKRGLPIKARVGVNYKVMQVADFLILASGTATLEAALYEKPMLITYKVSPWTWRLERPFLKGARFAGLPNLLAGREIVPEFLQENATAVNVASKTLELVRSQERRADMVRDLRAIREQLGSPGVMERVAKQILEVFRK